MRLTFLSREGCHLCDDALEELEAFRAGREAAGKPGFEVEVIDVEADDDLHRAYLERIPVILAGEEILSELAFDPDPIERRLDGRDRRTG